MNKAAAVVVVVVVVVVAFETSSNAENFYFTITAEIHARSLVNFYCQYADRHMNLKFIRRVSERESRQFDNLLS